MKAFEFIGCGRHRMVFRHADYVIKLPLNENGIHDNWHEYHVYKNKPKTGIDYARCRLIGSSSILVMEYARYQGPLSDPDGFIPFTNLPGWTRYVDCQQVGYNKSGKIVAYDYGLL